MLPTKGGRVVFQMRTDMSIFVGRLVEKKLKKMSPEVGQTILKKMSPEVGQTKTLRKSPEVGQTILKMNPEMGQTLVNVQQMRRHLTS